MKDWQIAVLNSEDIRVDQDMFTGFRLVIKQVEPRYRMPIQQVVQAVKSSTRMPFITLPTDPDVVMSADRKETLDILRSRGDYEEYMCMCMEAKMNGVI